VSLAAPAKQLFTTNYYLKLIEWLTAIDGPFGAALSDG
jgi:hypothetical protein